MNLNTRFLVTYVVLLCLLLLAHFIHIDAKHHHKKNKTKKAPPPSPNYYPSPPPSNDYPTPSPPNDSPAPPGNSKSTFDVSRYKAGSDGATDQFKRAWADACKVTNAVVLVPQGEFLVYPMLFEGQDCQPGITFQVEGTILAPEAVDDWGPHPLMWLNFKNLKDFKLIGDGKFDAQAQFWWELGTHNKPTAVRIGSSEGVRVTGLHFVNSPQAHLKFNDCKDVDVSEITINSPEWSPNTDGIHITDSEQVNIRSSKISCGDDCISMASGCIGINIDSITCGPSHGISIGSLGQDGTTANVSDITVTNCQVHDSDNGVRIKSYKGGMGLVENVMFSDIQVTKVKIGISIDQYYTDESNTEGPGSFVKVRSITFKKITGTYTKMPLYLVCGNNTPCDEITLEDISLKPYSGPNLEPTCQNAHGTVIRSSIEVANCLT